MGNSVVDSLEEVLCAAIPEFRGTIIKKELEYDGISHAIPVSSIPRGKEALVHILGRNDTDYRHRMGISWIIKTPSGNVIEEYSVWQEALWGVAPGDSYQFIGDGFTLSEVGAYTIDVYLFMNIDNPTIVDSYSGELCTVGPVTPPPEEVRKFPWVPVLIGGGAAIAVVGLAATAKGK